MGWVGEGVMLGGRLRKRVGSLLSTLQAVLKLGDVILSVNGTAGCGHDQTSKLLRDAVGEVRILVERKGVSPPAKPKVDPPPLATPADPPPPKPEDASPPPPPSFDSVKQMESEALSQLMAMGFGSEEASAALKQAHGDANAAVTLLTEGK